MIHIKIKKELKELIEDRIKEFGNKCDLNDIDISNVIDMADLFCRSKFNGNISNWDVSNVTNMYSMFAYSKFTKDISDLDVSNVTDMASMFYNSKFNQNINNWILNKKCKYQSNEDNRSFKNMILTNKLNLL